MIERSRVRVPDRRIFFLWVDCVDSYFVPTLSYRSSMLQLNTHAPYVCGFELNDTATGARLYGLIGCMVSVVVWSQWLHRLKEFQQTRNVPLVEFMS